MAIIDTIEFDLAQADRAIRFQSTILAHICSLQYLLAEAGYNDLAMQLDNVDFDAQLN